MSKKDLQERIKRKIQLAFSGNKIIPKTDLLLIYHIIEEEMASK